LKAMKQISLAMFAALSFLSTAAFADSPPLEPVSAERSRSRPIAMANSEQWTMRSKAGRTFEISIARPSGAAPEHGYPVMYVLDPSTAFATLVDTVRNHEQTFGPVVVVGVGYASDAEEENRSFDLTPVTDPKDLPPGPPAGWGGAHGGNDAFLAFILDELKPAVATVVAVDPSRQALFGHSLGGLFVLHVLFSRSDAFDTYIAGSPSIWWGKKAILREVPAFKDAQAKSRSQKRLLITVGELEAIASPEDIRLGEALKVDANKLMKDAKQVSNSADLARDLSSLGTSGLRMQRVAFPEETHNSVIPAYLARGARFTLQGWFE
jgi:predicted alpha/beta superfamily hydrolase